MSKLLLDEQPLLILPQLATQIGLNESVVLQQIHYWNKINKASGNNFKDGHHWTFNSYEEWQKQFPFWSTKTIQRTFTNLEKMKLIVVGNYNKLKIDRTKWYRIDYEALDILEESPFGHIGLTNMTQWLDHLNSLTSPLPETNTEINSENSPKKGVKRNFPLHYSFQDFQNKFPLRTDVIEAIEYYLALYEDYRGMEHPRLKEEQWKYVAVNMFRTEGNGVEHALSETDVDKMMLQHFKTKYQDGCDYNILHFTNDKVKVMRMFEVAY